MASSTESRAERNMRINTAFLQSKHGDFEFVHDLVRYRFIESVESNVECFHYLVYKSKKNFILVELRSSGSLDEIQEWIDNGEDMQLNFNFSDDFYITHANAHDVFDRKPITINWISRIRVLEHELAKATTGQKQISDKIELLKKRQSEHGNTFEFVAHYYELFPVRK